MTRNSHLVAKENKTNKERKYGEQSVFVYILCEPILSCLIPNYHKGNNYYHKIISLTVINVPLPVQHSFLIVENDG